MNLIENAQKRIDDAAEIIADQRLIITKWTDFIRTAQELEGPNDAGDPRPKPEAKTKSKKAVGSEGGMDPQKSSVKEQVRKALLKYPDLPAKLIAEKTGIKCGSITGYATTLGFSLVSMRDYTAKDRNSSADRVAPEPTEKASSRDASIRSAISEPETKPAKAKSGQKFRLRQSVGLGLYLHFSGDVLTKNKDYSWMGSQDQLLATRQKYPAAKDLVEEVVE